MTNCPSCKHEGAYVGTLFVECPNVRCAHFSKRQLEEWEKVRDTLPAEHDYRPPRYYWTHRFNDFGD